MAKHIAQKLSGLDKTGVNQILYANQDIFTVSSSYYWTLKQQNNVKSTLTSYQKPQIQQTDFSNINKIVFYQSQKDGKTATIGISKHNTSYYVESNTNLIKCTDCLSLMSIHAQSCPQCGCPLFHIADVNYKNFIADMLTQQRRIEIEDKKRLEREKLEKHQKQECLDEIKKYMTAEDFEIFQNSCTRYSPQQIAAELQSCKDRYEKRKGQRTLNINKLMSEYHASRYISENTLYLLSDKQYHILMERIAVIDPVIDDIWNWYSSSEQKSFDYHNFLALSFKQFENQIEILKNDPKHKIVKEIVETKKRKNHVQELIDSFKEWCINNNISSDIENYLTSKNFIDVIYLLDKSDEAILEKLQSIKEQALNIKSMGRDEFIKLISKNNTLTNVEVVNPQGVIQGTDIELNLNMYALDSSEFKD